MDQAVRFIIFVSTLVAILGVTDYLFFRYWRRLVVDRAWNIWVYKAPRLFAFFAPLILISGFLNSSLELMSHATMTFMRGVLAVWYIPKMFLVGFLLVKMVWEAGVALANKFRSSKEGGQVVEAKPTPEQVQMESRRRFVQSLGWGAASVPFVMVGHGMLKTVYDFEIVRKTIAIPGLPRQFEGLRIVQISDLHAGSFPDSEPLQEVARLLSNLRPDMLVHTGDWVNDHPSEMRIVGDLLKNVPTELGFYGSLGNHDHYMSPQDHATLQRILSEQSTLLVNEHRDFRIDGATLSLAGVDNIGSGQAFGDLPGTLANVQADTKVLLLHDPRAWDAYVAGTHNDVDLTLSGHTHGGQIAVDFFGNEFSLAGTVSKRVRGHYQEGSQHLYVNAGLGTTAVPVRVAVRPEITELTLTRATT